MIMPSIKCKCGNFINMGEIPNPNEWLIISDVEFDKFYEKIDAEVLYKKMKTLLICEKCNRLWVYWSGNEKDPVSYCFEE